MGPGAREGVTGGENGILSLGASQSARNLAPEGRISELLRFPKLLPASSGSMEWWPLLVSSLWAEDKTAQSPPWDRMQGCGEEGPRDTCRMIMATVSGMVGSGP